MNKVILMGRLTGDPDIRQSGETTIARYRLAVNRRTKDGRQDADFISCVAFNKNASFAEKYLRKGMQILVEGSINTGSYRNSEGKTIYTTDVLVNSQEFTEKKEAAEKPVKTDDFMNVTDEIEEDLPFN